MHKIKAGIIGGTGYTALDFMRLLHNYPKAEVTHLCLRADIWKKC